MPRYEPSYCPYCGAELVTDDAPAGYYAVVGFVVRRSDTCGTLHPGADETEALAFCRPDGLPDDGGLFHPRYRERLRRAVDATGAVAGLPAPATLDLRE